MLQLALTGWKFRVRGKVKSSRGGLNSNQDSLNAGPFASAGYDERQLSRSSPGTVPAALNHRWCPLRKKLAIPSNSPGITSHSSIPAGLRTAPLLPDTSASAGQGSRRCCGGSSRVHHRTTIELLSLHEPRRRHAKSAPDALKNRLKAASLAKRSSSKASIIQPRPRRESPELSPVTPPANLADPAPVAASVRR